MKKLTILTVCGLIGAQVFANRIANRNRGGDDCASGSLVFSWHMEDTTVTSGTPAGCSDTDTTASLIGAAVLSSSVAQDGTQSLNIPSSADYAQFDGSMVNTDEGTVEFYVYWTTFNSGITLFQVINDTSNLFYVESRPGGGVRIAYTVGGVTQVSSQVGAMTTGVWYRITAKWRASGSPNLSIQVDGGSAGTDDDDWTAITEPATNMRVGHPGGTGSVNFNLDNIKINNAWL